MQISGRFANKTNAITVLKRNLLLLWEKSANVFADLFSSLNKGYKEYHVLPVAIEACFSEFFRWNLSHRETSRFLFPYVVFQVHF